MQTEEHSLLSNIPDSLESISSAIVATRLVMCNATVPSELTMNEVKRIVIRTLAISRERSLESTQRTMCKFDRVTQKVMLD